MYWFPDIESARALARLYSESPYPACCNGDPDAKGEVEPESYDDAAVTPCPVR
jgi:hypothetical protein